MTRKQMSKINWSWMPEKIIKTTPLKNSRTLEQWSYTMNKNLLNIMLCLDRLIHYIHVRRSIHTLLMECIYLFLRSVVLIIFRCWSFNFYNKIVECEWPMSHFIMTYYSNFNMFSRLLQNCRMWERVSKFLSYYMHL